jgi:hypothetical protein
MLIMTRCFSIPIAIPRAMAELATQQDGSLLSKSFIAGRSKTTLARRKKVQGRCVSTLREGLDFLQQRSHAWAWEYFNGLLVSRP